MTVEFEGWRVECDVPGCFTNVRFDDPDSPDILGYDAVYDALDKLGWTGTEDGITLADWCPAHPGRVDQCDFVDSAGMHCLWRSGHDGDHTKWITEADSC